MTVRIERCTGCGRGWHPTPRACPVCGGPLRAEEVAGHGTVRSWTRIERPPSGFEAPQRVVLVTLHAVGGPEDGALVFAQAASDDVLETGRQVAVETAADGRLHARPA